MTTPHVKSDNRAIAAAEVAKLVNAKRAVLAAAQRLVERPTRWNLLALESAAWGLCDEYVTSLERENGRKPGAYGRQPSQQERDAATERASMAALAGKGKAFQPIVPRYDRGERALNRIDRAALAEMGKADGELIMGDSGPRVCAELDGDGA
jgi:hypothetical protein